jgi:hypothetical protein
LPSYFNYFNLTPVSTGLSTASVWIGGCLAGLSYGKVTDVIGRRPALFFAALITIVGVVLQTAAQDIAMFVVARIVIGYGTSASGLTGPAYLAETLPLRWRAWGLGVFNDFYYVGKAESSRRATAAHRDDVPHRRPDRGRHHVRHVVHGVHVGVAHPVARAGRVQRRVHRPHPVHPRVAALARASRPARGLSARPGAHARGRRRGGRRRARPVPGDPGHAGMGAEPGGDVELEAGRQDA